MKVYKNGLVWIAQDNNFTQAAPIPLTAYGATKEQALKKFEELMCEKSTKLVDIN